MVYFILDIFSDTFLDIFCGQIFCALTLTDFTESRIWWYEFREGAEMTSMLKNADIGAGRVQLFDDALIITAL